MNSTPVLVSGIQPSGELHIGNYLGALRNFVELQNSGKYNCIYFIADLHSLTEDFDPQEKQKQILELAIEFLAAGIDPEKSILFVQSQIPAHAELTWILNTITPMGELSRMTQFKDKGGTVVIQSKEKYEQSKVFSEARATLSQANVGLFDYPVLMAADILLYQASVVPVGDDQLQHLEFTRMIARKFNNKFGQTFIEPKVLLTPTPRIMSLDDPTKKMSKSLSQGCLYLSDSPEVIRQKIKSAVTDSQKGIAYDEKRPGIANLLRIYSAFFGEPMESIIKKYKDASYVEFKNALAEILIDALEHFRKERKRLLNEIKYVEDVLEKGAEKASEIAGKTLTLVQQKVGIL